MKRASIVAAVGLLVRLVSAEGSAEGSAAIVAKPALYVLPAGCGPAGKKLQCNPVTNMGCDRAKGEACDDDDHGGYACYAGPNDVAEGGACDDQAGCQGGLGCNMDEDDDDGVCARYCCSDAECGTKKCVTLRKAFGTLGFCE